MYTITYTVPSITNDIVHSIDVDDSLFDTFEAVTVGEVPDRFKKLSNGSTHDMNLWTDEFDVGVTSLRAVLYPLMENPNAINALTIDTTDAIDVTILSVTNNDVNARPDTYTQEVDGEKRWIIDEPESSKELKSFSVEFDGTSMVDDIMATDEDDARIKFLIEYSGCTIDSIEENIPYVESN